MAAARNNGKSERLWIGASLLACGALVAWQATGYELGSLRRMGPGYFPLMLGIALCVLAVLIAFTKSVDSSAETGSESDTLDSTDLDLDTSSTGAGTTGSRVRAGVCILGAMIVFALTIRPLGFAPATALTAIIAGLAEPDNTWIDLILLAVGITISASFVFVVGLNVPIPLVAL